MAEYAIIERLLSEGIVFLDTGGTDIVNKLILLFVIEKMDIPVTENTLVEMCTSWNVWMPYMDCKQALAQLLDTGFICQEVHDKTTYFSLTNDGRLCLANFFTRIPTSLRMEISEYINEHRMYFRRKQEYFKNFYQNSDGTCTVMLKIYDPIKPTLDIKMRVANRKTANQIYKKWEEKAALVYSTLYELLID